MKKEKKDPLNVVSSPVRIGHKNGSIEARGVQIYLKQFDQCLLSNDAQFVSSTVCQNQLDFSPEINILK